MGELAQPRPDPVTGAVEGGFGPDGDITAPSGEAFHGQHDPWFTGDRMLVHDNGSRQRSFTRVVEYRLPPGGGEAEVLQRWTEPGWFEPAMGGVEALPGGDWLITRSHCNTCGVPDQDTEVIRVDPRTGQVRWRVAWRLDKTLVYRAREVSPCAFTSLRSCSG